MHTGVPGGGRWKPFPELPVRAPISRVRRRSGGRRSELGARSGRSELGAGDVTAARAARLRARCTPLSLLGRHRALQPGVRRLAPGRWRAAGGGGAALRPRCGARAPGERGSPHGIRRRPWPLAPCLFRVNRADCRPPAGPPRQIQILSRTSESNGQTETQMCTCIYGLPYCP